MNMQEIHHIAKSRGIKPDHMYKIELIHTIQHAEGNFECFASDRDRKCDQVNCCWRQDCHEIAPRNH